MNFLQINTTVNSGSTGRIAEEIGRVFLKNGHNSAVAFGRGDRPSQSKKIRIGRDWNTYSHVLQTRLLDNHGFASKAATQRLLEEMDANQPDVVGLHNLHGYYIHVGMLFDYLKRNTIPVVWTLHDCWPFTGHCTYFDRVDCKKWKTHCDDCPLTHYYPQSLFRDRSYQNFDDKRNAFSGHPNLTIVTPSHWLKNLVKQSFLKEYPAEVIHNGVDIEVFKPQKHNVDEKIVLGVASIWSERKGLEDFIKLRKELPEDVEIVLIGLDQSQIKDLPIGITGIARTESTEDLAKWYSRATVFVNPTYIDNFPTTNIEALSCGTPVITYDTGGSPEAVDETTGFVVEQGDLEGVVQSLHTISEKNRESYREPCRKRAVEYYNKEDRFQDYVELYERMLGK
jgi:glycosyltransferase involved in cell wall biosynthesis